MGSRIVPTLVLVLSSRRRQVVTDDGYELRQQRYQLLTEVRNGAPMSSLFSIMSLLPRA